MVSGMPSRPKVLPFVLALAALLLVAAPAAADTYTVTRTDDPIPDACEPADCSLREALNASNATTTVDDVVVVPASASPYLIQYEQLTLPITDEVEIRGSGAGQAIIKGDGKEIIFTIGGVRSILVGLTITNGAGGIQNNGDLTLREVAIEGNERETDAGGVKSNGPLRIESSFVGFNRSDAGTGGGVQSNGAVTIVNSTIAHNTSKTGPGGIGANETVTIVSSAVVSNRSESAGSAGAAILTLNLRDSIFADNRNATGLLNCASANPLTSFGGNVSDDGSCGTTATDKPNVNPLLGPLALHGGTTQVYELLAGSPAIDAAQQCPALDQRGVARPQGAACDSGPYEYVPQPVAPVEDHVLAMRVGKGKLKMDRKGRIRIRLTCPATETSPPCRGKVTVVSRRGWPVKPCDCVRLKMGYKAAGRFSIPAGKTQTVVARLPRRAGPFLKHWKPLKVLLLSTAEDAAGNRQVIKQKRKLVPR